MAESSSPFPRRTQSGGGHFLAALGCAALIEAALVGAVLTVTNQLATPPAGERVPLRVALQFPPALHPTPPPVAPPVPPPPMPAAVAPPVPEQPPQQHPPLPPPGPMHPSQRRRRAAPQPRPTAATRSVPDAEIRPPVPPLPPPANPSPGETASFEAALRRAVQAALIFPRGAQAAHEQGVAHVRFDILDGRVLDAVVTRSTGYPVLDEAALQTVRRTQFPPTPAKFAGRRLALDVDVVFQMTDDSDAPD